MGERDYRDYYDDDETCWQCDGEGGWNSCMEDCCPSIGGEEGCDDPMCWRRCDICKGTGHLARPVQPEGDGR